VGDTNGTITRPSRLSNNHTPPAVNATKTTNQYFIVFLQPDQYTKEMNFVPQPTNYHYRLDPSYIAQTPAKPRDTAKLMVINRRAKTISHHIFHDIIHFLNPNDVLVLNDTRVFPARLIGTKQSGGKTEILLLRPLSNDTWEAMGKNLKVGDIVTFSSQMYCHITQKDTMSGNIQLCLNRGDLIDKLGVTPIPPYIDSPLNEQELRTEYQTVYAREKGSAAAPTAGMHFTTQLLDKLIHKGIQIEYITLHVGAGTFAKLRPENITTKTLHREWYSIAPDAAARLDHAKKTGKRIVAVGTTTCRTLESAISIPGSIIPGSSQTSLFIMPGYDFKFVDALITNFHLPESSLLMLVTAFCHLPTFKNSFLHQAYQTAIDQNYRFFSFGDAMLIE
jgi:S-adenosylmethionine:tRNA ribosyltransferase-isomerase